MHELHRNDPSPTRRRTLRLVISSMAAAALATSGLTLAAAPAALAATVDPFNPNFGANVKVFEPTTTTAGVNAINTYLQSLSTDASHQDWGVGRSAVFFKPGTYGSDAGQNDPTTATDIINSQVGYYTTIAGLGKSPDDVTINGALHVDAQQNETQTCPASPWGQPQGAESCKSPGALNNFWRGLSNLSINPIQRAYGSDAALANPEGTADAHWMRWGVSQASPLRRVHIKGNLTYMPRFGQYSSGGFAADVKVDGTVQFGSQQQFFTRNSAVTTTQPDGVWNMVFSGTTGAPGNTFPDSLAGDITTERNTSLAQTPISREAPFLTWDSTTGYSVFVPNAKTNSSGIAWSGTAGTGQAVSLSDFFIAQPTDTADEINAALDGGKNLLLTPGRYQLDKSIVVRRAGTVVLGLGIATLTPTAGDAVLKVADVSGVKITGILVDAGTTLSNSLIKIGPIGATVSDPADPTTLSDVFFRVGGMNKGRADTALEVNSSNVLLDDIWAWRADHGATGTYVWADNYAPVGVRVNGANVTATGLFVEHFQKNQVEWNGEHGTTVLFQSELPYEITDQSQYQDGNRDGYAAYWVDPTVTSHQLYGGGVYSYFRDVGAWATTGFSVPRAPGVTLTHVVTRFLNGYGGIRHVVNGYGKDVQDGSGSDVDKTSWLRSYTPSIDSADTQAPVMTLTADPAVPGSGSVYTTPVDLTISATDNTTSAAKILLEYKVDDRIWKRVTVNAAGVGLVNPPNGLHTIAFRATDEAGNTATGTTWTGNVDAVNNPGDLTDPTPGVDPDIGGPIYPVDPDPSDPTTSDQVKPVVTIASDPATPGTGGYYTTPVTVTIAATDNLTARPAVEYRVNGGGWLSYTVPLTLAANGSYSVQARATDAAGNVSTTVTWTGTISTDTLPPVDVIKPIVAITSNPAVPGSTGAFTAPFSVTITATDNVTLTPAIEYRINGGSWLAYGIPLTLKANGVYTIEARATDAAGNVSTTVTWTGKLALPATPPAAVPVAAKLAISPAKPNGKKSWYKKKITITASGTAPAGQAKTVQVKIGKKAWKTYSKPLTLSTNGTTVIQARTVTPAKVSPVVTTTVKIDTKKPAKLKAKTKVKKGKRTIRLTAKDTTSKVAKIQYKLKGKGKWKTYKKTKGVKITSKATKIKFRAVDKAGNISKAKTTKIKARR